MQNASGIEWFWTITNGVAFLSCLIVGVRRTWRGVSLLRLGENGPTRMLFGQRLVGSLLLLCITGVFLGVGVYAMTRASTNGGQMSGLAVLFTVLSALIAGYNVLLLVTDPLIDRAIAAQARVRATEKIEARAEGHEEGRAEAEHEAKVTASEVDEARHADRDVGRDEGRDPVRDLARDAARDAEEGIA